MEPHIVRLQGGLGNQMFQYAFGCGLREVTGRPVEFDTSFFRKAPGEHVPRALALSTFGIQPMEASTERIDALFDTNSSWRSRLSRMVPSLLPTRTFREQQPYTFDPKVFDQTRAMLFDGYWQSARYFEGVQEEVRNAYHFVAPLAPEHASRADHMRSSISVSLHVRRGDYTTHSGAQHYFITCPMEYYVRAMDHILGRFPTAEFHVFSDEPKWARQHLRSRAPIHFTESGPEEDGPRDMHLMSLCQHHILANSSFSWWAAWLNPSLSKIVVAPTRWLRDPSIPTPDLLPPDWVRC